VAYERVGRGRVGLERGEAEQLGVFERRPREEDIEAFGEGLHLGQFGHATMYA